MRCRPKLVQNMAQDSSPDSTFAADVKRTMESLRSNIRWPMHMLLDEELPPDDTVTHGNATHKNNVKKLVKTALDKLQNGKEPRDLSDLDKQELCGAILSHNSTVAEYTGPATSTTPGDHRACGSLGAGWPQYLTTLLGGGKLLFLHKNTRPEE